MGKIFIIKKTPKQVKLWYGTYDQQGQDSSAHQTKRQSVIKQDLRTAQIPPQSINLKDELEEVKSIINNATSIKKAILKVKPDLCKNKANLRRQPRRQAAFQAAESILAILSEEAKRNKADAKEIFLAKRARTDNTVLDDKVRTENEAVEIVVPVEEKTNNYEADKELVITNKVPGEATAAVTISENTEKQTLTETPVPNLSEWEIYNELDKYLDGKLYC